MDGIDARSGFDAAARDSPALLKAAWEIRTSQPEAGLRHCAELRARLAAGDTSIPAMRVTLTEGACFFFQGNYARAVETLERAQHEARASGGLTDEADALNWLGAANMRRGAYGAARWLLKRSVTLHEQHGGEGAGLGSALIHLAALEFELGHYDAAMEHLLRARRIYAASNDANSLAIVANNLANLHFSRGDQARALEEHARSFALKQAAGNLAGQTASLTNMSIVHREMGNLDLAEAKAREAVGLAQKLSNPRLLALARINLGLALMDQKHLPQARALLLEAQDALRAMGDRFFVAETALNLARLTWLQGDAESAIASIQATLTECDAIGSWELLEHGHRNLADICEAAGKPALALRHLRDRFHYREKMLGAEADRRIIALEREDEQQRVPDEAEIRRLREGAVRDARKDDAASDAFPAVGGGPPAPDAAAAALDDPLTGVQNRSYLESRIAHECERSRRFHHPLSLAVIRIEDQSGAPADPASLRIAAELIRGALRTVDGLGRWEGGEFVAVLVDTPLEARAAVLERVRAALRGTSESPTLEHCRLVVGVAGFDDGRPGDLLSDARLGVSPVPWDSKTT